MKSNEPYLLIRKLISNPPQAPSGFSIFLFATFSFCGVCKKQKVAPHRHVLCAVGLL